jgi:hypothetical protein
VAGPAPWNAETRYPGNPLGDWAKYFADTLAALPTEECDGFAIHTYTRRLDPSRIRVDIPYNADGYRHLRDEFGSYKDFMEAVPQRLRGLPVFITETDPPNRPPGWEDGRNVGWVRTAYEEIANWNATLPISRFKPWCSIAGRSLASSTTSRNGRSPIVPNYRGFQTGAARPAT